MDAEELGTGSPVHEQQTRKERAAIAAQACETCRSRKTKCDEQRPRCGLCVKVGVECKYREPQPTKKDRTLVEILDSLRRLEGKIDSLGDSGIRSPPYPRIVPAHKLLLWPAVREVLESVGIDTSKDLEPLKRDGTQWLIRMLQRESNRTGLPLDVNLESRPFVGMQTARTGPRVVFPELSAEHMQNVSGLYFTTFNFLYPLLDRELFYAQTLHRVTTEGFGEGDVESVITLLVLALGQCAFDGSIGESVPGESGRRSGIRGGTTERPPGLALFNEARRRMGFLMTQCELENVQDLWRMAAAAAMACRMLVSSVEPIDWSSRRGDHIKRAYWHCVLMENGLTLELDLPETGISEYEDLVPPPDFNGPYSSQDMMESERSHYQYHFLAQMALKKLYSRVQSTMYDARLIRKAASGNGTEKSDDYGGPPVSVIRELARQLESWRELLPAPLQWSDDKSYEMPRASAHQAQSTSGALFVPDHYSIPITHGNSLDILVAVLRTRFYFLKYMIYRPFVYKALHYPEKMTAEDINNCKACLKSCLRWPLCMSPPRDKKRLLPQLFSWTQNFLGILFIFHMTTQSELLGYVCDTHFEPGELEESASLMLDWVYDMKKVDCIAEWGWRILERLSSQIDGVPADLEASIRFAGARLTQAAGVLLRLPQDVAAQAIVLYSRFWVTEGGSLRTFGARDVSAACLYLAAKLSAHPQSPRNVLNVYALLVSPASPLPGGRARGAAGGPAPPDPQAYYLSEGAYLARRAALLRTEARVLRALGFQTHVALPYTVAINYLQALDVFGGPEGAALARRSFAHLTAALASPQLVYLTHQPPALATAAVYLAARELGVKLPAEDWWEVFDVDREELGFLVVALKSTEGFARSEWERWRGKDVPVTVEDVEGELEARRLLDGDG
ncbi:hypothetical protein FGG08_001252 [Glutinoglossum americanum]|uniref:Zn(2)-C6 fungal-type domain-containing protein n=1 Tax=Glutinoglossum americanum TaxID=1670608 RepID=A0A9P8L0E9_9PEZI|nr:hypothetical protein FGG08_001252 [Glutinoglossum americanum]